MHEDEIKKIMIGSYNGSTVIKYNDEISKIRNSFLDKIRNDFNKIWMFEKKEIDEEKAIIDNILAIVNCEDFSAMVGNDEYLLKVEDIFSDTELCVGTSKMRLAKMESCLNSLKSSYNKEFENYCSSVCESLGRDIQGVDSESQKEIKEIFGKKIISKRLFNELKNEHLI